MGIIGDLDHVSPDVQPTDPSWRPPVAMRADVTPEYFAAARVQLVDGRLFEARDDAGGTPVVIVNETLARQFWPGQSPIGRMLTADGDTLEVVGVARNGKYMNIGEAPRPAIFRSFAQTSPGSATLAIRTARPPSDIGPAMRAVMQEIDPDVAVYDVRSMATHLDNGSAFMPFRLAAFMTTLFGGMGMLLASIGLYGMIAYHVGQRTQEIGVRMALGARAADIIRDVLAQGGRFALIGIGIGMVLAAGLAQLLKGLLLGISPFDPITYASRRWFAGRDLSARVVRAGAARDDYRSVDRAARGVGRGMPRPYKRRRVVTAAGDRAPVRFPPPDDRRDSSTARASVRRGRPLDRAVE